MSGFADIFQPLSKEKVENRRELADLEESCSRKRCMNCDHWMKTPSCPRERRGEKPTVSSSCGGWKLQIWDTVNLRRLRKAV